MLNYQRVTGMLILDGIPVVKNGIGSIPMFIPSKFHETCWATWLAIGGWFSRQSVDRMFFSSQWTVFFHSDDRI